MMNQNKQDDDAREAWVLRAGAELWKAVVAEAASPAEDTQKALAAVRHALNCARRLRCAGPLSEHEYEALSAEAARASEGHVAALQQWGQGRGFTWEWEWGMQWGEALSAQGSVSSHPTDHLTNNCPNNRPDNRSSARNPQHQV